MTNRSPTARTEQRQEQRAPERQPRRAEQDRLAQASLLAQAALEGMPLLDAPPQTLEELAGRVGNTAMQALLDAQAPQPEEFFFSLPEGEPDTAPIQVPAMEPALIPLGGLSAAPDTGGIPAAQGGVTADGSAI